MIENYKTLNCTKGKFPVKLSFFWKICSLLPKKSLTEKFIFCAVLVIECKGKS